eukprot:1161589-Pelagomonas_calceolata.AAC.7
MTGHTKINLLGPHTKCQGGGCAGGATLAIFRPAPQQSHSKLIPEHFAHNPICPPDMPGMTGAICLACMLSFRAGGAQGGPGQPGVNFPGKEANLGAHAP